MKSRSFKKIALTREALHPESSSATDPANQSHSLPTPIRDNSEDYHLIRMKNLMNAVSAFTCCGSPLTVKQDRRSRRGFVVRLDIVCSVCGKTSNIMNPYREEDLQVNTRAVVAARSAGKGRTGLCHFAGMMGMLPPLHQSHYATHSSKVLVATREACYVNMCEAAAVLRRAVNASEDEVVDVKVTCDATWQKRGHQSLYGVVVVASWETGQVLDIEVLSKYCRECNKKKNIDPTSPEFLDWWETHQADCDCNYDGTSGDMEKEGALRIWRRSVHKYKLRYTSMIADGDSSTYPTISAEKPYGEDYPIEKHECVGHVQKRMFKHLQTLKQQQHRDEEGKFIRLGGRNRLTKDLMLKLQRWYGKAIRSNPGDAVAMSRGVMAIFYHSISTEASPLHHMCPTGPTSWCKHNRAAAKGESPPPHHHTIPYEICHIVKRVFINLSNPSLMERCVLGATQNQCESFNSVIWNRCPKVDFYSSAVVEIAANMAVLTFNSVQEALKNILKQLNIPYGPTTEAYLMSTDDT